MPPSNPWKNPVVRGRVVTGLMLVLLGMSFAMAWGLTWKRSRLEVVTPDRLTRETVGTLEIAVPKGWTARDLPRVDGSTTRTSPPAREFLDPMRPRRRLIVATLRGSLPRPPGVAFNLALNHLLDDKARRDVPSMGTSPFRTASVVGIRCAAVGTGELEDTLHFVAVLTADGRSYWVVYLIDHVPEGDDTDAARIANLSLFDSILQSTDDRSLVDPHDGDLSAVGLTMASGAPITALSSGRFKMAKASRGGEPMLIVPTDAQPRLRVIRVRGVQDAGDSPTHESLAPEALLREMFEHATGRAPDSHELSRERLPLTPDSGLPPASVSNFTAWRVTFTPTDSESREPALVRQIWYVRVGGGRALLAEVLSEPVAIQRAGSTIGELAIFMAAGAAPLPTDPGDGGKPTASPRTGTPAKPPSKPVAFVEALRRGEDLAAEMRGSLVSNLSEGWDYFILERRNDILGAQVARRRKPLDADPLPLRGVTMLRLFDSQSQLAQEWSVSKDGRAFRLLTRRFEPAPRSDNSELKSGDDASAPSEPLVPTKPAPLPVREVGGSLTELKNQQVTCRDIDAMGASAQRRTQSAPPALIPPMAEDVWPRHLVTDTAPGASIVWILAGRGMPAPFWVEREATPTKPDKPATGASPDAPHAAVLLVRPLMSLEADRLILDADGRVVRVEGYRRADSPMGPSTINVRRTDREGLIQTFPYLEPNIRAWEQDDQLK